MYLPKQSNIDDITTMIIHQIKNNINYMDSTDYVESLKFINDRLKILLQIYKYENDIIRDLKNQLNKRLVKIYGFLLENANNDIKAYERSNNKCQN